MKKPDLSSTATKAPSDLDKESTKAGTAKLLAELGELQNLLYAESKHALLVILQGMDASGKDGVIRKVFEPVDPMGCRVVSFKAPTELELKHDFLWRVHQQVPEKGMIHLFNRSHYEDVIIQRVHRWVDEATIAKRFVQINDFEKLLMQNGTVVLKYFLHVSKDEQLERLNERLNDPSKMWKHNDNDLKEREHWKDYMRAYEDAIFNCSKSAEWTIVPADQNWYKEYVIAKSVVSALRGLDMKYPGLKK